LGSIQKSPGEIGAIEYHADLTRALQARTRQICPAQVRPPEIGIPKIGAR
jgi:hypothetical protein